MMDTLANTYFAPAGREPVETLQSSCNLLQSEEQFVTMLEAFPTPAIVINRSRQILLYNSRFSASLPPSENKHAVGLRIGESLGCVNEKECPEGCGTGKACRFCGAVIAMMQAQKGAPSIQECRMNTRANGRIEALDFRVLAVPMTVCGMEVTVISLEDISNEKWKNALERIFFHDVLNTASGLKSLADLYPMLGDAERVELIDDFEVLSTQLIDVIQSQRLLLAAERRDLQVEKQETLPGDVLRHVEALFRFHPVAKNKRLVCKDESRGAWFLTDPPLLSRVLENLVKNAFEASEDGETVTMVCDSMDGQVMFSVHNAAVMPEDVRYQIFQRSFSTKGRDRGLGTYGARLLTEFYLEGKIDFASEPGLGTIFTVTFEASVDDAATDSKDDK